MQFNFLVAEVSPVAFSNIGWRYYLVYVCTNSLSIVFIYLFCPETKGRSLEDIDMIFLSSNNTFETVKMAKSIQPGIAEEMDISEKAGMGDLKVEQA